MLALRSVACQIEDLATPMEATGEMDSETPEPGHALATRLARWRTGLTVYASLRGRMHRPEPPGP